MPKCSLFFLVVDFAPNIFVAYLLGVTTAIYGTEELTSWQVALINV